MYRKLFSVGKCRYNIIHTTTGCRLKKKKKTEQIIEMKKKNIFFFYFKSF